MKRENAYIVTEYLATFLTLIGFYMISEAMIAGFAISLISNILWIVWANHKNAAGIMAVNLVLLIINLNGLGII